MDWLRRLRGGTTTGKRRTSTWPNLSCSKYFMNPTQRAIITGTSYFQHTCASGWKRVVGINNN
eukprot:scaffold473_cov189-Alexandrium_tamarense.AAC.6